MTDRTRNIIVGFTALIGLGILATLMILFGEVPAWVTDSYSIQIHLNDAAGIASGSRIRLNGLDVGYVESVRLKEPAYEGAVLSCQVESQYDIPSDALVAATASLLGSTSQLNIRAQRPAEGARPAAPLPRDGKGTLRGKSSGFTDAFAGVAERLEVDLREQLKKFGKVSDEIVKLSETYRKVGDNINSLMEPQTVKDVDEGKAQANIRTLIARADGSLTELKGALEQIKEFASDEMREEVRGTIGDARQTIAEARKKFDTISEKFIAVADDLGKTLENVNGLLAEARGGRGTLGKLVQDPALYDSLTDAAHRLNDAITEAKLLIQKWKSEGLPVHF